jgi:hypothetical protein
MPTRDLFYRKAHGLAIKPNHTDNRGFNHGKFNFFMKFFFTL